MEWKCEYPVGIEEIDDQHRKLLEMFIAIEQSIEAADSWNDIHLRLVGLKELAASHFTLETALMRFFGYEGLIQHMATHRYFFDKLAEMGDGPWALQPSRKPSNPWRTGPRITSA